MVSVLCDCVGHLTDRDAVAQEHFITTTRIDQQVEWNFLQSTSHTDPAHFNPAFHGKIDNLAIDQCHKSFQFRFRFKELRVYAHGDKGDSADHISNQRREEVRCNAIHK